MKKEKQILKWHKPKDDCVLSKCGRFCIIPFIYKNKKQIWAYKIIDKYNKFEVFGSYGTQKEAKLAAEKIAKDYSRKRGLDKLFKKIDKLGLYDKYIFENFA